MSLSLIAESAQGVSCRPPHLGNAGYRVLHGWTEGRNEYYIRARALTYRGPDWDEAWTDPAEELHARQENPATYHNFVDQAP
jgi:hypothetical protein